MAKVLSMQVGEHIIRLAEIQVSGKVTQISKIYTFDIPDEATKDGKVRLSDEVVTSIRAGLIESNILTKDVYFAIESSRILFKSVEIPYVADKLIQSTLTLSLTDLFNVDDSLYHISYVKRGTLVKDEKKMLALEVFAVPNDVSESYYNLAVALGLSPKGVTDTSHSVLTLLNEEFQNRNVATVNLEESTATLAIISNGEMIFHKTIPHGIAPAMEVVRKYAREQGGSLNFTESVEQLYTNNILLEKIPEELVDFSESGRIRHETTISLTKLIKNIDLAFTQFLQKEQGIRIQEIVVTGLGGGIANISKLMAREFNVTVKVFQAGKNILIGNTVANEVLLISSFPLAGSVKDQTNFFTLGEKAGGEVVKKKKIDTALFWGGLLVMVGGLGYGAYTTITANLAYTEAESENKRVKTHVDQLRALGIETKYAAYTSAFSYNEEIKNLYLETESVNDDMTIFLQEVEMNTPIGATITAMEILPTVAEISITTNDQYIAAGTLHLFRNMRTVNGMECKGVVQDEITGECMFTVTFMLKTAEELKALWSEDPEFAQKFGIEVETEDGVDEFEDEYIDESVG